MKNKKNERIEQYILIILFLFLLFLPLADQLFRIFPEVKLTENRQLANISRMTEDGILKIPNKFETYYNDNFGLRTHLIRANNILNVGLFSTSPNTAVVLGSEDWLYLTWGDESIFEYKKKLTEKELKSRFDVIKYRKELLAGQGIQFFVVIAPNKHSIYPEFLPEYLQKLNKNSKYDQITEYLGKNSLDINIDVKNGLMKEKQKGNLVYFKSNTHWNDYGNFIAYQQIIAKLGAYYPELKPMPLNDFNFVNIENAGDLAKMLGMEEYFKEKTYALIPKNNRIAIIREVDNIDGIASKGLMLSECNLCGNLTIVIVGDSFMELLRPLIAEHFSKVVYIQKAENPEVTFNIIKKIKPEILLYEIVERDMNIIY